MKPNLLIITLIFSGLICIAGATNELDSLMCKLDETIAHRKQYDKQKESTIDSLKKFFNDPRLIDVGRYELTNRLINEYRPYIHDSSYVYIIKNLELARKVANRKWQVEMSIELSNNYISGGLYKEAIDNLLAIRRADMDNQLLKRYYLSFEQTYLHMSIYAKGTHFENQYAEQSTRYLDSVLMYANQETNEYKRFQARSYVHRGNTKEAIRILIELLPGIPFGTHSYAMLTSTLANVYASTNDMYDAKKFLILSAISDIMSSVKENESLRNLSILLLNDENVDKAYTYCNISMEDANSYNARLRRIQNAKTQPIIERTYQMKIESQHQRLRQYFRVISFMCLLSVVFVVVLLVQNRIVRRSRREVIDVNNKLKELNKSLIEANHVKEGYLGLFLTKCSFYINKLEKYRSTVYSKLATGKIDELKTITKTTDIVDYEIKEFYATFDKTFLKLYPTYINDFNELLRDEERVTPANGELLSTELRIFALIRLGISDSSRIANFLRYSANTVYTYRTKVKNKTKDRNNFEVDLMKIGQY